MPYDFQGYHGSSDQIPDHNLFWLNYNPESEKCLACRLGSRGVSPVPCETTLSFACERKPLFATPPPPRPEIIELLPQQKVTDNRIRVAPLISVRRKPWSRRLSHITPLRLRAAYQPNIYSFNPYLRFWKGLVKN